MGDEQKIQRPFGMWESPITPHVMARQGGFSDLAYAEDGSLVWLETRAERGVLVVQPPDGQAPRDLNSEFSVRGQVGYGGGDFTVGHGWVYFVDARSGRIFRQALVGGSPQPVTPAYGQAGAPRLSPDGRWLMFVHTYEGQDTLEIVDAQGRFWPQKLVAGDDFYMQPAWSPDSQQIAWIAWNHPNMPWDGTLLRMGRLQFHPDNLPALGITLTIAGDEETAIFQPEFSPDGRALAYVSDVTGWGQLYMYFFDSGDHRPLTNVAAEHSRPAWIQGMRTYAFPPDGEHLYLLRSQEGQIGLWELDLKSGNEQRLPLPGYTELEQIGVAPEGNRIALLASGPAVPKRIITLELQGRSGGNGGSPTEEIVARLHVQRRSTSEEIPPELYSTPQAMHWTGIDGEPVYGLFYPPHHPRFLGVGKPPLLVHIHGGPTDQARQGFNGEAQFFTSRGYAYLDVNYRGSTGYGRTYQDALRGNWGVYDVQDAVSGARALVEQDKVDGGRLVIVGGSAGGYTVLKAVEDFPGFFKAGICRYGISNQFLLAMDTHKFEAHYNDALLGRLPEAAEIYRQRSPIYSVDRIKDPVALFQGEEDMVVPRQQSDAIVESLRRQGVPFIYHVYPGEGHGFRKPETMEHYYQAVLRFLQEYVIFS